MENGTVTCWQIVRPKVCQQGIQQYKVKHFESKIFNTRLKFVQIVDITLEAYFEPYQPDSKVCKKLVQRDYKIHLET